MEPATFNIELVDMLAFYPTLKTPEEALHTADENFQTLISAKEEFAELASSANENSLYTNDNLYNHQLRGFRYMKVYPNIFILDEPGTGKTKQVLAFTEYAYEQHLLVENGQVELSDPLNNHFRRTVVLVASDSQAKEIETQLVCKSTTDRFLKLNPSRIKDVRPLIRKWYYITTYEKFVSELNKQEKANPGKTFEELVISQFSHSILWIDEAHNLSTVVPDKYSVPVKENANRKHASGPSLTKVQIYNVIARVYNILYDQHCKRIITTATPMINRPNELAEPFNLLLPPDQKLPKNLDFYNNATLEDLKPYFQGRITFVRTTDTGIDIIPVGDVIMEKVMTSSGEVVELPFTLIPLPMSEIQDEAFREQRKQGIKNVYRSDREISNLVMPDGSYGKGSRTVRPSGLAKYTNITADGIVIPNEELSQYLTSIEGIKALSPKFAYILETIRDTPNDNHYIFAPAVSSDVLFLSLCLRYLLNFEEFIGDESIYEGTLEGGSLCSAQVTRHFKAKFKVPTKGKRRFRFATITGQNGKYHRNILEAMSSKDNMHAEVIQVIILSAAGREGLNIGNIKHIHIPMSEWNEANMFQAIYRAIRSDSHKFLLEELVQRYIVEGLSATEIEQLRTRYIAEGVDEAEADRIAESYRGVRLSEGEALELARIPVKVYKYATYDSRNDSFDVELYLAVASKDIDIKRILRIMKQCSINCQIDVERNGKRATDVDFSSDCHYDTCNYPCSDPSPIFRDYSTYDVYYADELIDTTVTLLVPLLRQYVSLSFAEIMSRLQLPPFNDITMRAKAVIMGLEYLIFNKIPILDRFGYAAYLQEDAGIFYLDRTYPVRGTESRLSSIYNEAIITVKPMALTELVKPIETRHADAVAPTIDVNSLEDLETVDLTLDAKIIVIEGLIAKSIRDGVGTEALVQQLQFLYPLFLYLEHEPVARINTVANIKGDPQPKRGRPPKENTVRKVKALKFKNEQEVTAEMEKLGLTTQTGEIVYIHSFYVSTGGNEQQGKASKFFRMDGRLRLLKPSDLLERNVGWRDLTTVEFEVYNELLQFRVYQAEQRVKDLPAYGLLTADSTFRIVTLYNQGDHKRLGMAAGSSKKGHIAELLYTLGTSLETLQEELEDLDIRSDIVIGEPKSKDKLDDITIGKALKREDLDYKSWDADKRDYIFTILRTGSLTRDILFQLAEITLVNLNYVLGRY